MLSTLNIRNLALVDQVSIEFQKGLNVITGETGAGKSLLISALRLLLGERADKSMIRTGETTCSTEAVFELPNPAAANTVLAQYDLPPCEDNTLIIRRTLSGNSSKNAVNDSPVTLTVLRALGNVLVDMHGPYDHQSLLKTEAQMDILDAFGQLAPERTAYQAEYQKFKALEKLVRELDQADDSGLEEQIEMLTWRIKEVEDAQLTEEDEAEVQREHEQMANSQNILEMAQAASSALTESEYCAFDGLSSARAACSELARHLPTAADWVEELEGAARTVQEISAAIQGEAGDVDSSPERLEFLDERLTLYQSLKRKYAPTVPEILSELSDWKERLTDFKSRDIQRARAAEKCAAALTKAKKVGSVLSKKRRAVAVELAEIITRDLRELGFKHGLFAVDLIEDAPSPSGLDQIEFGFAPNAGESMRPLRSIASSGEISRVMLAVKAVLARHDQIPLMVFDEIDANVGGEIANDVGNKLAQVGETHQLIAITHLPQVAVCGATHFAVAKQVEEDRTFTRIERLDDEGRTEEIARMLGGKDLTQVILQHASELLAQRHSKK